MSSSNSLVTGLDRVTYGVEDLAQCRRFYNDWGLREVEADTAHVLFETLERSQVELRSIDDEGLPDAIEPGSTVREVCWGVERHADLDVLERKLDASGSMVRRDGNAIVARDADGMRLTFQVTVRQRARALGAQTNSYGRVSRVNQASPIYERAHPVRLSHIVLFTNAIEQQLDFYQQQLGFHLSDSYPGEGYFLRCQPEGGHHDLFLLATEERGPGLNHLSFMVRDIYEVFGGGIHMNRRGWKTQIGPGRHPISSAVFWYVASPCGALTEYYADEDYVTADWQPREFQRSVENFAEWAIIGGIDPKTRKQMMDD